MQLVCSGANRIGVCSRCKALENLTQRAEPGTSTPFLPPCVLLVTLVTPWSLLVHAISHKMLKIKSQDQVLLREESSLAIEQIIHFIAGSEQFTLWI